MGVFTGRCFPMKSAGTSRDEDMLTPELGGMALALSIGLAQFLGSAKLWGLGLVQWRGWFLPLATGTDVLNM